MQIIAKHNDNESNDDKKTIIMMMISTDATNGTGKENQEKEVIMEVYRDE